jgi:hypothetical protein
LSLLEAAGVDSLCGLDAEVEGVEGTEDLINCADFGFVLEIDAPVELGEAAHVGALHHELVFGLVEVDAVGDDVGRWALVESAVVPETSPASAAAASSPSE